MPLLALVHVHDLLAVDGQVFVRVDHNAEKAGVRLRERQHETNQSTRSSSNIDFRKIGDIKMQQKQIPAHSHR